MLRPDHVDVLHILNGCKDPRHGTRLSDRQLAQVAWIMAWRWKTAVSRASDRPMPPVAVQAMN